MARVFCAIAGGISSTPKARIPNNFFIYGVLLRNGALPYLTHVFSVACILARLVRISSSKQHRWLEPGSSRLGVTRALRRGLDAGGFQAVFAGWSVQTRKAAPHRSAQRAGPGRVVVARLRPQPRLRSASRWLRSCSSSTSQQRLAREIDRHGPWPARFDPGVCGLFAHQARTVSWKALVDSKQLQ